VVEGVRVALPAAVSGQRYQEFVRKYQAKYGEAPDVNVIKSYDAMKLVAFVIQKVGDQPSKIKEYLRGPDFEYNGISGPIRFDEHGDLVGQEYTRMVYRAGKLVPFK
jgi:branched-chain amino acid transport system substrate-binding protein